MSWVESSNRWQVELHHDGHKHYVGRFAEAREEDAARAFDTTARRIRGTNANGGRSKSGVSWRLNYPTPAEIASAARIAGNSEEMGMILQ